MKTLVSTSIPGDVNPKQGSTVTAGQPVIGRLCNHHPKAKYLWNREPAEHTCQLFAGYFVASHVGSTVMAAVGDPDTAPSPLWRASECQLRRGIGLLRSSFNRQRWSRKLELNSLSMMRLEFIRTDA